VDGPRTVSKPWMVSSPIGRRPGDHVCWPFRRDADAVNVARAYVAEGLAGQERVAYVGEGGPDELRHDLDGVPTLDEQLHRGRLQLIPINTLLGSDTSVDPTVELPLLAAMTETALAAGYRALRVFARGTSRVRSPTRRAQHVRYEHLIDRYCLEHPLTMFCAYDAAVLGNSAVAELACVHALAHEALSPFRLSAARSTDAALAGNVDVFCTDQLEQALRRIGVGASGGTVVIDATSLEFIDVRGLLTLDRHAAASDAVMVLRSPPTVVTRLAKLVDLIALRVEGGL
jgi:MEDS: MEthanogen/methylotroph, DcmR Sensory domain/STAS domain